jgi:hypothetical protein
MTTRRARTAALLLLVLAAGGAAPAPARASDAEEAALPAGSEGPLALGQPTAPEQVGPFFSPLDSRSWQVNLQATYVLQRKLAFDAPYTGPHSLIPAPETGFTLTSTLSLGYRPWPGGELFFNLETIQSSQISNLTGLAGESNGENQRGGGALPTLYLARLFLRQTFDLGGTAAAIEAGPNQFASTVTSRRLVLTVGYLAVTDVFDANAYSHDPRTSFLNWALWTYGASDFAADSRGYTFGIAAEYDHEDWAFRLGRFAQPIESNGLPLDYSLLAHFGDVLEIEHDHVLLGRSGRVRLDAFHNRAVMGAFADALSAARSTGGAPTVATVRKVQSKYAIGLNVEQELSRDAGAFARLSWNDGRTETFAYAEIERSLAVGASVKGRAWGRADDTLGLAWALNGLSADHRAYLGAGGLGFFIGDGQLDYGPELILEGFYSARLLPGVWASLDGQYIANPAYNRDRGPVKFLAARVHLEY